MYRVWLLISRHSQIKLAVSLINFSVMRTTNFSSAAKLSNCDMEAFRIHSSYMEAHSLRICPWQHHRLTIGWLLGLDDTMERLLPWSRLLLLLVSMVTQTANVSGELFMHMYQRCNHLIVFQRGNELRIKGFKPGFLTRFSRDPKVLNSLYLATPRPRR